MGRTLAGATRPKTNDISTHSPRVGRTISPSGSAIAQRISTHSPRVGRTQLGVAAVKNHRDFNSLAPCGANPLTPTPGFVQRRFQLTRPVWGEPGRIAVSPFLSHISTHSPRVGRTQIAHSTGHESRLFQLTRPVWGEPRSLLVPLLRPKFQLTRPVWGEPLELDVSIMINIISTHSPRVGRTLIRTTSAEW